MKIILTITMFALTINAYSQKLVKEYYDWGKTKIKREYYTDAYGTLNGSYKAYSEYGGIMKQGQCKNDGPIGKWIENYDNGKLHYIKIHDTPGTYDFQVKDGKIISYYEDGKTIKYERNFKNMELDGVWKEYDESGTLIKEGKYVNGVFERTGVSLKLYEEEQEKQKQLEVETLLKNTEEYKKIIPEADKAFVAKDYFKALELYKSASDLLVNEKYPKDKISEIIETYHSNSNFFEEYIKSQYDSIALDELLFKNIELKDDPSRNGLDQYENEKEKAWDCIKYRNWSKLKDFKTFFSTWELALAEYIVKYGKALALEESNINASKKTFTFNNTNNTFYSYDKNVVFQNLSGIKNEYKLAKSLKDIESKCISKKKQIEVLNDENKKKHLFNKYQMLYNDLFLKYESYSSLQESFDFLNNLNSISDKVIALYSQETKDLEKQLKNAETVEQIKTIILGK